jgi:hypothetical protein
MAILKWKPRVMMLSTNNPDAATSFQIGGSSVNGFQTFTGAGYANGDLCKYTAMAVNGSNVPTGLWETGVGTIDTAATPDELDRPTAVLANSSGGTSKIDFSGATAVMVFVEPDSDDMSLAMAAARGHAEGGLLSFNSTTAVAITAGRFDVNGKLATVAAATYTSGSTMLDISGATVTLGASKAYFVFTDVSGTVRFEERDGTGDGADPTFDVDLNYWKSASTGAAWRRIGKFWANASSQVIKFWCYRTGLRQRTYRTIDGGITLVSAGTAATLTSLTITPYYTADDDSMFIRAFAKVTSGSAVDTVVNLSVDGSANIDQVRGLINSTSTGLTGGTLQLPYTGSLYYSNTAANPSSTVFGNGFAHMV